MNRTVIAFVVLLGAIALAVYFFVLKKDAVPPVGGAAGGGAVAEISEVVQKAIDFCKEKGGTIETVTAAEGVTHLCVAADGVKAEVSKYMADNQ